MTPEEAIKILEKKKEYSERITDNFLSHSRGEIKDANETIEMCDMAISALKEIQQYREIGTVEECREAVEKQKPKAPKDSLKIKPVIDENGAYVDADVTVYLLCPNCGEMVGIDENVDKFCRECGQAIDTENLEETENE